MVREYLKIFFKSDVLDGPRRKTEGGVDIPPFDIPCSTSMPDYRSRVETLPDLDNPASFGMAANSDRSLQRINSSKVIVMLRQLASAAGGVEGGSSSSAVDVKAWKEQLSPLWKMWENASKSQLSKLKNEQIRTVTPEDPPVVAFLLMDAAEANRLGDVVTKSLSDLQRVVNGTGLSTPDIQLEAKFLARSEAPPKWAATWKSAPEDPTVYLQGLSKRIVALKGDWVKRVGSNQIFDKPVNLSDFLRPEVFLNALRQQTARKLSVSIDSLHLVASFEPHLLSDTSSAPLPVTVEGLILEGCAFDDNRKILVEGSRTSPLVSVLSNLTIAWMGKDTHPDRAVTSASRAMMVGMPIYVSLSREHLVGEVYLHTDNAKQRVLNAAALFLTETN